MLRLKIRYRSLRLLRVVDVVYDASSVEELLTTFFDIIQQGLIKEKRIRSAHIEDADGTPIFYLTSELAVGINPVDTEEESDI